MDALEQVRALRKAVEAAVDLFVTALDAIDPDPELEDSDEDAQVDDDRCDVADSGDDEPSLGSGSYGGADLEADILSEPHDSEEALA